MVKILDCTLRDGGLVNDSNFSDEFARAVLRACESAGIGIVEVGFRNSQKFFSTEKFGKWRFCEEKDLREVFSGFDCKVELCTLVDAGKCDISKIPPKSESIISRARCAFYAKDIDSASETLEALSELGYKTSACMMASPELEKSERRKCLNRLCRLKIDTIYLMDSFGTLLPNKTREIFAEYADICAQSAKTFGAHFHNNLQCAFANSLAAIDAGAGVVDATIGGLGKGAGNCPTELLAGAIFGADAALPLSETSAKFASPIMGKYKCGFFPQYMLTALLGIHPRPAMEYSKMQNPPALSDFYKNIKEQL